MFAGIPASAPAARQLIRGLLADCPRLDDCELVASEFIANAIRHSASGDEGGTFVLRIVVGDDRVRIEVEDEGNRDQPGVRGRRAAAPGVLPVQVGPCGAAEYGRGLFLVQAIADETGHYRTDGNGHVAWAELDWYAGLPELAAIIRASRRRCAKAARPVTRGPRAQSPACAAADRGRRPRRPVHRQPTG
jgi:serine/threonine-protein kinase RsbW